MLAQITVTGRVGEFPVTQKGSPATSRRTCRPWPGPRVRGAELHQPPDLVPDVVGSEVEMRRVGPLGSSSCWKSSWSGDPASSCHLPANSTSFEVTQRPANRARQKNHLPSLDRSGRIDAYLHDPRAVPIGRRGGLRRFKAVGSHDTERKPTGGSQRDPAIVLSDERCAEFGGSLDAHPGGVGLDIQMHPWRPVDLLKVQVRGSG